MEFTSELLEALNVIQVIAMIELTYEQERDFAEGAITATVYMRQLKDLSLAELTARLKLAKAEKQRRDDAKNRAYAKGKKLRPQPFKFRRGRVFRPQRPKD